MDTSKCLKCRSSAMVGTINRPSFRFLGCYSGPYDGKWVIEIDECPKDAKFKEACKQAMMEHEEI